MAAYSYALGAAFAATGTAAYSSGNGNVIGTGTAFTTEFETGDVIYVNGHYAVVFSVTNDTAMSVAPNWSDSATGQAVIGYDMKHVETDLGLPAPKGVFIPYSQPLDLGGGGLRGGGWPAAEWRWGFLTLTQRNALRALVTGASAAVVVRTTINDSADAYVYFTAQALWPQSEERDAGRRRNFTLRFRALVEIP